MSDSMQKFEEDIKVTIRYKGKLLRNKNLMHWYKKSYDVLFSDLANPAEAEILEIGSGTSPIKFYHENVVTSDILPLEFVEYHFDAMEIDTCQELEGKQFDIITFTNVLHHIKMPLELLEKCKTKLKPGGRIVFLEPYFSLVSSFIYKYVHYEYSNKQIQKPELENIEGPLSSSNIAMPYLIFFKRSEWLEEVKKHYEIDRVTMFTSLSYFLSGGISYRLPVPGFLYRLVFSIDAALASMFPSLLSSFFVQSLRKK